MPAVETLFAYSIELGSIPVQAEHTWQLCKVHIVGGQLDLSENQKQCTSLLRFVLLIIVLKFTDLFVPES